MQTAGCWQVRVCSSGERGGRGHHRRDLGRGRGQEEPTPINQERRVQGRGREGHGC